MLKQEISEIQALTQQLHTENSTLKETLKEYQSKFTELTSSRIKAEQESQKNALELLKRKQMMEEEVKLRLEFENKINKINNYNRKLQV